MGTLQINLLGASFSIKSSEDTDYLNKLLAYYKNIVNTIEKKGNLTDALQISIMAGITMCDQVYKDKKTRQKIQRAYENDTSDSEATKIMGNLLEKLDTVL